MDRRFSGRRRDQAVGHMQDPTSSGGCASTKAGRVEATTRTSRRPGYPTRRILRTLAHPHQDDREASDSVELSADIAATPPSSTRPRQDPAARQGPDQDASGRQNRLQLKSKLGPNHSRDPSSLVELRGRRRPAFGEPSRKAGAFAQTRHSRVGKARTNQGDDPRTTYALPGSDHED